MKKILSTIVLLAISICNAQVNPKGTTELIPLIGYSSANYYGENTNLNGNLSGLNVGLAVDYYFSNRWSLRSGLLYQTMGTKINAYEERLKYITIPVNANWHFSKNRRWNLNFGLNFGFNTSGKGEGEGLNLDLKEVVEPFQLGLSVGIGYKIEVSPKFSILLDYQSMAGLTNVVSEAGFDFRNAYSSFNVGGVFKI